MKNIEDRFAKLMKWLEENPDSYKREFVWVGAIIVTRPSKCPDDIMRIIDEYNENIYEKY